jgi:cytoskeletal protein RodZ
MLGHVSIGGALAEARQRAGLTVADVSAHTRIRQAIIRAIERDDFGVCGGDFYARGHIRAIARTVGLESEALVREYDTARIPASSVTMDDLLSRPSPAGQSAAWEQAPAVPPSAPQSLSPQPVSPRSLSQKPLSPRLPSPRQSVPRRPVPDWQNAQEQSRAQRREQDRQRPRKSWVLLPVLLIALAVISFGSYRLVSSGGGKQRLASAANSGHPAVRPRSATASQQPSPGASTRPSPTPSAAPAHEVTPVSASAFGSGGTSDGDNPQEASLALSGNSSTPWTTDWYTTAQFGNLTPGTGLLLDLGRTVTATGVTIHLGSTPGASLQVRAGTSVGSLSTVASTSDASGTVTLHLKSPAQVRYLVIWFTALPPDANGTYQAAVSGVTVAAS